MARTETLHQNRATHVFERANDAAPVERIEHITRVPFVARLLHDLEDFGVRPAPRVRDERPFGLEYVVDHHAPRAGAFDESLARARCVGQCGRRTSQRGTRARYASHAAP